MLSLGLARLLSENFRGSEFVLEVLGPPSADAHCIHSRTDTYTHCNLHLRRVLSCRLRVGDHIFLSAFACFTACLLLTNTPAYTGVIRLSPGGSIVQRRRRRRREAEQCRGRAISHPRSSRRDGLKRARPSLSSRPFSCPLRCRSTRCAYYAHIMHPYIPAHTY